MKNKIFFFITIFSIIVLATVTFSNKSYAASSPLQIAPAKPNASCAVGLFSEISNIKFDYNGGTVKLSSASNGTGNIYTDDKVDIEVTHPDSTKSTFSQDYGSTGTIVQTSPQTVTNLFKTGINTVKITQTNLRTPQCGASAYWLVETAGGGGGTTKPNILPRSAWKGDDSGSVTQQTPNRIVIHHTATSNIPGGTGTYLRELRNAILTDPVGVLIGTPDIGQLLNKKGDYSSVRFTWAGEIFLAWIDHKFLQNYNDLGYQYIVDPTGTIYEGRWKGGLAENADNVGVAVTNANTGAISIAVLGKYGSDLERR